VPSTEAIDVDKLRERIARHDWVAAHEILRFDPMKDTLEFRVLSCPTTRKMVLLTLDLTFEPLAPDRVIETVILEGEDTERIDHIAGDQWRVL